MSTRPMNSDLIRLARRLFWWKTPAEALQDRHRFLAQVMTYGSLEDVQVARRLFTKAEFEAVLNNPPSGVFDERSWNYWNLVHGRYPPPPVSKRNLIESQD